MDGSCPPRAINGTAITKRTLLTGLLLILLVGNVMASPPVAKAANRTPPIAAFNTTYRFKIAGFPFPIKAQRTLKPIGDGVWRMQVLAHNFIGEIRETSLFRWHDCTPVTTLYGYRRQGLGQVKSAAVHIDRKTRVATSERSDHKPATFKVPDDTTDKISVVLALQCKLARGDKDLTVSVADERGLSRERYAIDGPETLKIGDRNLPTVRLHRVRSGNSRRQTLLWFAPDRGYTLVQLVQKNDDGRHVMTLENP